MKTRLLFEELEIAKDGLTYVIGRTHREREFEGLLTEDPDGWYLQNVAGTVGYRIGRRKSWIKALHDALTWIDQHLEGEP